MFAGRGTVARQGQDVGILVLQAQAQRIVSGKRGCVEERLVDDPPRAVGIAGDQQRGGLGTTRVEGRRIGRPELALTDGCDMRIAARGLDTQSQRGADRRDRGGEVGIEQRLLREITRDGLFGTRQQAAIDQPARQVRRAGVEQDLVQRGGGLRPGAADLLAQALGQLGAHRAHVHLLQHGLLERGHGFQLRAALFGDGALRTRLQQAVDRHRQASDKRDQGDGRGRHRGAVPADELADAVARRRRHRGQRMPLQETAQVLGQLGRRLVAVAAAGRHCPCHHPVQFAARCRQRAGPGPSPVQQLEQDHAEGVDVAAGIDQGRVAAGLLRAHVVRGAGDLARLGIPRVAAAGRGGDAEVDDLRKWPAVDLVDQQVAGLQVAMHHAALVRVLHALADTDQQPQARLQRQLVGLAVRGQRAAGDELHREPRLALGRGPGVEDLGDGRMPHLRQQLPFDLEVGEVARVHAPAAHQLQRHRAPHRLELFRAVNLAHAAATDQLDDPVATDARTRLEHASVVRHRERAARGQEFGAIWIVTGMRHGSPLPPAIVPVRRHRVARIGLH